MFCLWKKEKYLLFVLIFCLLFLFIPQQKVLGENEEMKNENLNRWLSQLNQQTIKSFSAQKINNDLKLFSYKINNNYYGYALMNNKAEILEYGEGKEIPYQADIIINTDIKNYKLTSFTYFSPLENYWILNTSLGQVFIEGSSGEWLLDLSQTNSNSSITNTINLDDKIGDYYVNKKLKFDPYDDLFWLTDFELQPSLTKNQIIYLLKNNQKIIFIGKKYDNQVDFAYSIIGFHLFEEKLFIATYDFLLKTIRFISYEELNHYGDFLIIGD